MSQVDSLKMDIAELRDALLDAETLSITPPNDLSHKQRLLVTSFVILAHAHIEEFIEQIFQDYADLREADISDDVIPKCFISLSLYFSEDLIGQGAKKYGHRQLCQTAKSLYRLKVVSKNNGLKTANIEALTKPLGLYSGELTDSCNDLLSALNTLGAKRGKMAHNSVSQSASETIYASQATEWVESVLQWIHQLVDYLHPTASGTASPSTVENS